jgi:hypothetical protein
MTRITIIPIPMYILLLDFGFSVELKVFSQRGAARSTNNTMAMFSCEAVITGTLNHREPRTKPLCLGSAETDSEVLAFGINSRVRGENSAS